MRLLLRGRATELLACRASTLVCGASVAEASLVLRLGWGRRRTAEQRNGAHALAIAMSSSPLARRGHCRLREGACSRTLEKPGRWWLNLNGVRWLRLWRVGSHDSRSVWRLENLAAVNRAYRQIREVRRKPT